MQAIISTMFGDVEETAWVRDIDHFAVDPPGLAEDIAMLLACTRAFELAERRKSQGAGPEVDRPLTTAGAENLVTGTLHGGEVSGHPSPPDEVSHNIGRPPGTIFVQCLLPQIEHARQVPPDLCYKPSPYHRRGRELCLLNPLRHLTFKVWIAEGLEEAAPEPSQELGDNAPRQPGT